MHQRRDLILNHLVLAPWLLGTTLILAGCQGPSPLEIPAIPTGENPTRFAAAIERFAEEDLKSPGKPGRVVVVGSSSIRRWRSLAEDMAPVPVVHRGFGGARLFDAIYYSERLVSVHRPSLVVVFCGTNDIAGKTPKTAVRVRDLFRHFVARLRWHDDDLVICNIAITPTLARKKHIATVHEANRLIRADCDADPNLEFVDPSIDLVDAEGVPDPRWFARDRLHLNADGYRVWTRHIRPVVHRLYARETGGRRR